MPTRLLRRKNLVEAALLAKLISPDGELMLTGRASSEAERGAESALVSAAEVLDLPLTLGVMGSDSAPSVADLLRVSDGTLQTSVQEGFGLGSLESALAGCPFMLRRLPILTDYLEQIGCQFPSQYQDLIVPPKFMPKAEASRREALIRHAMRNLPDQWRGVADSAAAATPPAIAFAELTLTGQLEVLAQPGALAAIGEATPNLQSWKELAKMNRLPPATADESRLSALENLWAEALIDAATGHEKYPSCDPIRAVTDLFQSRLAASLQHPLLFPMPTDLCESAASHTG